MLQTHFLAEYLASKHYGMWLKGKFKFRVITLLSAVSHDPHDTVLGVYAPPICPSPAILIVTTRVTLSGPLETDGF